MNRGRVKVCRFCEDKAVFISYKEERVLRRFVTERGKVIPRRMTGTCARHQRGLVRAIKRARHIALMPYVAESVR
ncbi:MAG: 30S ribosomal protein S18 [Candidatus Latescibacteria bacterium]|jgi:small subunit ribosomal protein S18|nr:30S ribosomal protein S18 [Candidatus Latescibacterota bacterium]